MHWSAAFSNGLLLALVAGIPLVASFKKIDVFSSFVDGAREGFDIAIKIIPYLVAFLVALGMFRAAGGFALLERTLGPLLTQLGFPVDLLPLALIRPFSGGAANAVLADIAQQHGGNSFVAHAAATMMGSTETTFYVVMLYFGAVNIVRTRHAIVAGLFADCVGIVMAVVVTHWFQ